MSDPEFKRLIEEEEAIERRMRDLNENSPGRMYAVVVSERPSFLDEDGPALAEVVYSDDGAWHWSKICVVELPWAEKIVSALILAEGMKQQEQLDSQEYE